MKKRGEVSLVIFTLFIIVGILLFEFLFLYNFAQNKSEQRNRMTGFTIREPSPELTVINIYPEQQIGKVREDFYGVNTQGTYLDESPFITNIATSLNECNYNSNSNIVWHKEKLLASKIKGVRVYLNLELYANKDNTFNNSFRTRADSVKFAYENDLRALVSIWAMPEWLANSTTGWCYDDRVYKNSSCSPINYSEWGNFVVKVIDNISNNGEYNSSIDLELGNEMQGKSWLNNLTDDNPIKSIEYNKLFNATLIAVHAKYPNMPIGGYGGQYYTSNNLRDNFLSNFSENVGFISFHSYLDNGDTFLKDLNNLTETCYKYNANCSRIIISEWNILSPIYKNSTNGVYNSKMGEVYSTFLNNYPTNISSYFFAWSSRFKYSNVFCYPEYPQRWSMVSEPQLDNAFYPPYNVTKDFAHYHASGNMIINSSSSNNTVKVVASINPEDVWHMTVIITGAGGNNVSINLSSVSEIEALKDLETGEVYNVVDEFVDVGVLEQYDVKHYESTERIPVYEIQSIKKSSNKKSNQESILEYNEDNADITNLNYNDSTNITYTSENETLDLSNLISEGVESDSSSNTKSSKHSSKTSVEQEEEERLSEKLNTDISGASTTGLTAEVKGLKNKVLFIISFVLIIGIITVVLIIFAHKRKRKKALMKILNDWIYKAYSMGYTSSKMKEMLEDLHWDKEIVEKALGED